MPGRKHWDSRPFLVPDLLDGEPIPAVGCAPRRETVVARRLAQGPAVAEAVEADGTQAGVPSSHRLSVRAR